jgi:hypothetical protein
MSPRDGDVVATLATDLFQALGVGDFGGIGVTLNTLQDTVHRPLEEGLIDEESDQPSCRPLLGQRSIAVAGEAVLGGRQGLRRNGRQDPRQDDQGKYKDAAEGIPSS